MSPHDIRQAICFFDMLYRQQKEAIRDKVGHIIMQTEGLDRNWEGVSSKLSFEREYINMGDPKQLAPVFRFIKRSIGSEILSDWYDRVHCFLKQDKIDQKPMSDYNNTCSHFALNKGIEVRVEPFEFLSLMCNAVKNSFLIDNLVDKTKKNAQKPQLLKTNLLATPHVFGFSYGELGLLFHLPASVRVIVKEKP